MTLTTEAFMEMTDRRASGIDDADDPISAGETITIGEEGASTAKIRLAGGYILDCSLKDRDNNVVPLLYGGTDTFGEEPPLEYKISATHLMNPVGPRKGQPQHGRHRYTDYRRVSYADPEQYITSLEELQHEPKSRALIAADVPKTVPRHFREVGVSGRELQVRDSLLNSNRKQYTSFGQHFYWVLNSNPNVTPSLEGFKVTDSEDRPLFTEDALQEAFNGNSQYVPLPLGIARVAFADGRSFSMQTSARMYDHNRDPIGEPISGGLLAWRRQGTNSICIEDVYGMEHTGTPPVDASSLGNQGIVLPPNASIDIHTFITA
jgi:hypothetical protein